MKTLTTPPSLTSRKQTIAQHFANANDYDQHASIQRQVCQSLLSNIADTKQNSILEVGAGTGQLTRLMRVQVDSSQWVINELCAKQAPTLQAILPPATIKIGDAETMDLGEGHSLVISANAIQWFDNPISFVAQSAQRLQSGGQLLFSTFTPDNFLQIKALTAQGLNYPEISEWHSALTEAGFENISLSIQRFDLPFISPYAVLKHMKLTGVSTNQTQILSDSTPPFRWTKSRLQQFEIDYWQQFSGQNDEGGPCVYLTYEVLIVSAFKP